MRRLMANMTNTTSKDAKKFAPYFCTADNTNSNTALFTDIALAMSVFFGKLIIGLCVISDLIIKLINIIIINKNKTFEKAVA